MKWLKKHGFELVFVVILLCGVGLLLYPSVADYWNGLHQSRAIANYAEAVAGINDEEYAQMMEDAKTYNETIARKGQMDLSGEDEIIYNNTLNIEGTGMMAYIEIDKINCSLPIYHSTDEDILQVAVGHIEGTSLPIGGESTHCVLSGHRGLPSAKLFSDLDLMEKGDIFVIRVLDEILTYEVDQILIVEPEDTSALEIVEGEDLCTLVTCTPYGVNTHRLLVRGHRVANRSGSNIRITADAMQIEPVIVAPCVAIPILLILIMIVFTSGNKKKSNKKADA